MKKKHTSTKEKINPIVTQLRERDDRSGRNMLRINPFTRYDRFLGEHNEFIGSLANDLGHPFEHARVIQVLKAVLHTLRDRVTIQRSLHILAQLPAFLKLYYIEDWKYREKPIRYHSAEEFCNAVDRQFSPAERKLFFEKSTEEIINIVLASLRKYLDEGSVRNIFAELPLALQPLFA
jgi:uncharacterized protein (DUF2267 family)